MNLIPFWLLLWIGVLCFLVRKYRFIPAMRDFIYRDIMENIEEGIVLCDADLRALFMNRSACRLLNAGEGERIHWMDFVFQRRALEEQMRQWTRAGVSFNSRVDLVPRGGGGKVPVDLKMKRLIDSNEETSAWLIIIARVKDGALLRTAHGLTGRELEVIRRLVLGKTNKEMAAFFGITEKTIEAHLASIYGKLKVKGRGELLYLLSTYDPPGP